MMFIKQQAGFTLIEIVIAFGILVMLFSLSYSALSGITSSKQLLDDGRDAQAIANSILTRLTRELQLADVNIAFIPDQNNSNNRMPSGVNLLGEDDNNPSQAGSDRLSFMAHNASQYILGSQSFSGECKLSYRLEIDPDNKDPSQKTFSLVREEIPNIRPLDKAYQRRMVFPISNRLLSLNFRYYDRDNEEWLNSWGKSNSVGLPASIEVSIELLSPQGTYYHYTTAVPLLSN